ALRMKGGESDELDEARVLRDRRAHGVERDGRRFGSELGAAGADLGFELLDLILQGAERGLVRLDSVAAWPPQRQRRELSAGARELIEEALVLGRSMALERGDRVRHRVEGAPLSPQDRFERHTRGLSGARRKLRVKPDGEVLLVCGLAQVKE